MKKYIYILVAFIACAVFSACNQSSNNSNISKQVVLASTIKSVEVLDGASNPVEISTSVITAWFDHRVDEYMRAEDVEPFVQNQFTKLEVLCNHPRTFVPKDIYIPKIKDTLSVEYGGNTITLYRYECMVSGYAKNSFGVEGDVNYIIGFERGPEFLVKNDFGNKTGYFISSMKHEDGIPFKYNGKTYYIDPYSDKDEWIKQVCSL